jgi:hypothetical protein
MVPLIYVWMNSRLPDYGKRAIEYAKSLNPDREVILLCSEEVGKLEGVISVQIRDELRKKLSFEAPEIYGGQLSDFWRVTAERLLLLREYTLSHGIRAFFHAEIDNLVFNIDGLEDRLNVIGSGIFSPRDCMERSFASFIYVNEVDSLGEPFEYFKSPFEARNEMEALGYMAKLSKKFFSLPTESFTENAENWKIVPARACDGIFDAISIGQYLFGLSPHHRRYGDSTNRHRNENCRIDIENSTFLTDGMNLFLQLQTGKPIYRVFNVHVHSKRIDRAIEFVRQASFARIINNGGQWSAATRLERIRYKIAGFKEALARRRRI